MILAPQFDDALQYAVIIHAGQLVREPAFPISLTYSGSPALHSNTAPMKRKRSVGFCTMPERTRAAVVDIRTRFGDAVADIVRCG
jgi:hypothetical protein